MIATDITDILETVSSLDLQCHLCNNFLSVPPILTDVHGSNTCGRCENHPSVDLRLHNVQFEILARQFKFPCQFIKEGCSSTQYFQQMKTHEEACPYQRITCRVASCKWSGILTELIIHMKNEHQELIIEHDNRREISEGDQCFLLVADDFHFLLECSYRASKFSIKVQRLNLLISKDDLTFAYFVSVMNTESLIYGTVSLRTSATTDVPRNSNGKSVPIQFSVCAMLPKDIVNKKIDIMKELQCPNCSHQIVPPILKCPQGHLTCVDCADNDLDYCDICNRDELLFSYVSILEPIAASVIYVCRWKGCGGNFSVREIQLHEQCCSKRLYKCLFCPAWHGFKEELIDHYDTCVKRVDLCPTFFDTELTVFGANVVEDAEAEYALIAHKEIFYCFITDTSTCIEAAVCNNGPPSLFGWFGYVVTLEHSEHSDFPFNKTYRLASKSSCRYTFEIPKVYIANFGGLKNCKITIKINLLHGKEKQVNIDKHFRWVKKELLI